MLSVFTLLFLVSCAGIFYHWYSLGHVSVSDETRFCKEDNHDFSRDEDCLYPKCLKYGCDGLNEANKLNS